MTDKKIFKIDVEKFCFSKPVLFRALFGLKNEMMLKIIGGTLRDNGY